MDTDKEGRGLRELRELAPIADMDTALQPGDIPFRRRATKRLVLGFCGALGIAAFFVVVCNEGDLPKSPLWSVFSAPPFGYYVVGFIESVTKHPYRELPRIWRTLKLSDRVLLGVFLFFAISLVLLLVAASLLHLWLIARGDG